MDFSGIKRVEWTIDELSESTKTDAKDLNDKLVIPGGKNWSIDEKAGHHYGGRKEPTTR